MKTIKKMKIRKQAACLAAALLLTITAGACSVGTETGNTSGQSETGQASAQKEETEARQTAEAEDEAGLEGQLCLYAGKYTDGTYTAEVTGSSAAGKGSLTVTMTVLDGEITALDVEAPADEAMGRAALSKMPARILAVQGTEGIDTVSGCTQTSEAILEAALLCETEALSGYFCENGPVTGSYRDGTYTAVTVGAEPSGSGDVTAELTIKNGRICALHITAPKDSASVGRKAVTELPLQILAAGTTEGIDAVTGATLTSEAVFTAVNDCLGQAEE